MKYIILTEAKHPDTGEVYKVGDIVTIYQGRFGHNNIMTINSMFTTDGKDEKYVYVSDEVYTPADYKKRWPSNPKGTFLNSVKRKLTQKQVNEINRAKAIARQYT